LAILNHNIKEKTRFGRSAKMRSIAIDHRTFFQVSIVHQLLERWKIEPKEFLRLDEQYNILSFLSTGYDIFHLNGDMGTIEEVEAFVREQGGIVC
jgi:hypothetical protein